MGSLRRKQRVDGSGDILFEPALPFPFPAGAHPRLPEAEILRGRASIAGAGTRAPGALCDRHLALSEACLITT